MDANAKLGGQIIENDPHNISDNGIILSDIIRRQNLTCVNATKLCQGSINRHRKTVRGDEKAIIDYVLVCDQLAAYLKRMLVDENHENVLTKYATLKGVRVKSESDHNPIYAEFDLTVSHSHKTGNIRF